MSRGKGPAFGETKDPRRAESREDVCSVVFEDAG